MLSYVQHGSSLTVFADDSKLNRPIDSVRSPALLQSDRDGLHSWSSVLVRPLLEYSSSVWSPYLVKHRRLIENIQRRATKFILNYPPREVSYINRLDQLNLLPLDFRRQMHDLVLLFKYKTRTVNSNFGRFIQTATRHYRTRNFHQANFDLLSRHNQEYYCNSYFPRTVKLWNSLPNILKSSQDLLWFRVHLNDHFRGVLQTYSPP